MFVDIHTHILPGLDDGAADTPEALQMLKQAAQDWTRYIIATPHFTPGSIREGGATIDTSGLRNSSVIVRAKTEELAKQISLFSINVNVRPGTEVLLNPEIPELLESGDISSLNGSRYILVEFPMSRVPSYAADILFKIQLYELTPIIAHPERCGEITENLDVLQGFIQRGMLAQVNSGSLTGSLGTRTQKAAFKIIKSRLAHFVASDAHSSNRRRPCLSKAAALVEKNFGYDVMQQLFYSNGMAVIENRVI